MFYLTTGLVVYPSFYSNIYCSVLHPNLIFSLLVFTVQVLQGGGLESPTKPKGRPKKNSIPSSEQLSEQERSAAEPHSEGSSSHLESTQEEWPDHSPHILWLYMQKVWDAQCVSFRWGQIPKRALKRMWCCALTWTASCQLQRLTLCRKLNCACCHLPAALQWYSSSQHALPHGELSAVEEGNLCSRSTLYILQIHSHSPVLHSFCVLCLIIKYIFTIAAFLFIVKKIDSG